MQQRNAHKLKGDITELQYSEWMSYAPPGTAQFVNFHYQALNSTDHIWISPSRAGVSFYNMKQMKFQTLWRVKTPVWIWGLHSGFFVDKISHVHFYNLDVNDWILWHFFSKTKLQCNFCIHDLTEEIMIVTARTLHLFRKLPEETARMKYDLSELPYTLKWVPSNTNLICQMLVVSHVETKSDSDRNSSVKIWNPNIVFVKLNHNIKDIKCLNL